MTLLQFSGPEPSGNGQKKTLMVLIGIGAVAGVITLSSTLAASINLNSGTPVEFSQGVTATTSCTGSDSLTITPYSSFNNADNVFSLTDISISHIPDSCLNRDFLISAYSDSGPLSLDGTSSVARVQYRGEYTSRIFAGTSGNFALLAEIKDVENNGGYGSFTIHLTAGTESLQGSKPLASDVTRISVQSQRMGTEAFAGLDIVTDGLQLGLNANNENSYISGDTWLDLSPNHYDFELVNTSISQISSTSDRKYFAFRNDYSLARHNSSDVPLNLNTGVTYVVVTRIATGPSTGGGWRTLTRGLSSDHQVLLGFGPGTFMGTYQNGRSDWIPTNFDVSTLPSYGTNDWVTLYIRFKNSAPYMTVSAGDSPGTVLGYSSDSHIDLANGIYALGNYNFGTQPWGDIAAFYMYNRVLTDIELLQNFHSLN